jgi:hypothetical protein
MFQTLNVKHGNGHGPVKSSYLGIVRNSDNDCPATGHKHFRVADGVSGPVRGHEPERDERALSDELEKIVVRHRLPFCLPVEKRRRDGKRAGLAWIKSLSSR